MPAQPAVAYQQLTSLSGVHRQSQGLSAEAQASTAWLKRGEKKLGRASKRAKNEFLPTVDPISRRTPSSGGPKLRSALCWSCASQTSWLSDDFADLRHERSRSCAARVDSKRLAQQRPAEAGRLTQPGPRAHRRRRAHPDWLHAMSVQRRAASFSSVAPVERANQYRRTRARPSFQ
jgi:hypothetical protein